jgi:hypothetical protein
VDRGTVALAVVLALAIVAAIAWRVTGGSEHGAVTAGATAPVLGAARTFGDLRLSVPRGWTTLARDGDRITWGAPDRSHVVTLSATEASSLPLMAVVGDVADELAASGVEVVDGPTLVDPGEPLPRGDSFVLVRLRTSTDHGQVDVVQAWRRDSRASADVVATWTSTDGRWPVDPRTAVPSTSGGG